MPQGSSDFLTVSEPHAVEVGVALEEGGGGLSRHQSLAVPGQHREGSPRPGELVDAAVPTRACVVHAGLPRDASHRAHDADFRKIVVVYEVAVLVANQPRGRRQVQL